MLRGRTGLDRRIRRVTSARNVSAPVSEMRVRLRRGTLSIVSSNLPAPLAVSADMCRIGGVVEEPHSHAGGSRRRCFTNCVSLRFFTRSHLFRTNHADAAAARSASPPMAASYSLASCLGFDQHKRDSSQSCLRSASSQAATADHLLLLLPRALGPIKTCPAARMPRPSELSEVAAVPQICDLETRNRASYPASSLTSTAPRAATGSTPATTSPDVDRRWRSAGFSDGLRDWGLGTVDSGSGSFVSSPRFRQVPDPPSRYLVSTPPLSRTVFGEISSTGIENPSS